MKCFSKFCKSDSQNVVARVGFFRFPKENWEHWLKLCGYGREVELKSQRICSLHFDQDDLYIDTGGKVKHRKNAIPIHKYAQPAAEWAQDTSGDCMESFSSTAPRRWICLEGIHPAVPVNAGSEVCSSARQEPTREPSTPSPLLLRSSGTQDPPANPFAVRHFHPLELNLPAAPEDVLDISTESSRAVSTVLFASVI